MRTGRLPGNLLGGLPSGNLS